MKAIDEFESRFIEYKDQDPKQDLTAPAVYLLSHKVVYAEVTYMVPEHPPGVEILAIIIKDVCQGESHFTQVFEKIAVRYISPVSYTHLTLPTSDLV